MDLGDQYETTEGEIRGGDDSEVRHAVSQRPVSSLPLQQRPVQITLALVVAMALISILWAGRTTFGPPQHPPKVPPGKLLQIDINQAELREFALLPGVGPVLAERIVTNRRQNGDFISVENLSRVHGIGQKTIQRISAYCLPVDGPAAKVALVDD